MFVSMFFSIMVVGTVSVGDCVTGTEVVNTEFCCKNESELGVCDLVGSFSSDDVEIP